jgi:hypothetical protein
LHPSALRQRFTASSGESNPKLGTQSGLIGANKAPFS